MVVLRVLDDGVGDHLLVAEDSLVVVIRGQIAVDHLGVVSYADLEITRSFQHYQTYAKGSDLNVECRVNNFDFGTPQLMCIHRHKISTQSKKNKRKRATDKTGRFLVLIVKSRLITKIFIS